MKKRKAFRYTAFAAAIAGGSAAWAQPTLTALASFNGTDGSQPHSGVIADVAGNLYGTTVSGGTNDDGTVFEVAAETHAITNPMIFTNSDTNGYKPLSSLIADASGNMYGTTGQAVLGSTVFEIAAGTHAYSQIATFGGSQTRNTNLALDPSGNLFGTTSSNGPGPLGGVFEVAAGTEAVSNVVTFNGTNGASPVGGLVADGAGNIYGTTGEGGDLALNSGLGVGTVFEISPVANPPHGTRLVTTTVATFNGTNGQSPHGNVIMDAAGNLYGTTDGGGQYNDGTVFEVLAGTNTIIPLASFNGTNGMEPTGLIIDADGDLFGVTNGGGRGNDGTIFEVPVGTDTISTLAAFSPLTTGFFPDGPLSADAEGDLYGTASAGGSTSGGTVFELTDSGFVVPEPACLSMLGLTGLALLARRRPRRNSS